MSIQDRLMDDLKAAMREGDATRREAIRMVRAAVLHEEKERQRPLNDVEVFQVLQRLVNRHQDSIEQFQKGGREDLVAHEQSQLAVVRSYLPQQMGREEIEPRVRAAIAETGASGRGDIGKVMQRLSGELRGKADLKEVNRVVQELLGA
jgi:uncharacterized protein YqeY